MDVFAALADPVRRDLVRRLARAPHAVTELAAHHAISRPAISRHLRALREAGLVEAVQDGRRRVHELRPAALAPVEALLADVARGPGRIPDHRLDALGLEVRRTRRERDREPRTAIEEDTA
jgi:DNA-binding transcriptional ArsR family regulator